MNTRDLSVGQRLYLGFGVVLLLMGALVMAHYNGQQRQDSITRELTDLVLPRLDAANGIETAYLLQSAAARSFIYSGDSQYIANYQRSLQMGQEATARLEALPKRPEGAALFAEIQLFAAEYVSATGKAILLRQQGDLAQAQQVIEAEMAPARDQLIERAEAYQELQLRAKGEAAGQLATVQRETTRNTLILALLSLACALVVSIHTARAITTPTRTLVQASRALASGEYESGILLASTLTSTKGGKARRDEIAMLAEDFASMARTLFHREQRLAAQGRLSSALASTIDVQQLANATLKELAGYTQAEFGLVYAHDSEEGVLEPVGSYALNGHGSGRLKLGEGIPGEAAVSRRRIVVRDIPRNTPFNVHFGFDRLPPRTVAAIPMVSQDQLVGTLVVGSVRDLPEEAMEFLDTAAQQAAVSIQNALTHQKVRLLAEELQEKNELLAAQNEELQAQAEELQAQNEEIQAQSEEIQSQNEELQSQNEEIISQSQELSLRNQELAQQSEQTADLQTMTARLLDETRAQEQLLRNVLEEIPEAVFVIDGSGQLLVANDAARKMFNLGTSERPLCLSEQGNEDSLESCPSVLLPTLQALRGEKILAAEIQYGEAGGSQDGHAQVSAVPVLDEGRVLRVVTVGTDISQIKELERAKDEFLAIASHELKTPITPVIGYAQMLHRRMRSKPDSEAECRMAESIVDQAKRIARLVDRLLNLSRAQMGRLEMRSEPVDLTTMVRDLVEITQIKTTEHRLLAEVDGETIGYWDRGYLEELIVNLLDNAIRYSPEGGDIRVGVSRNGTVARLMVTDQGIGIPPEVVPSIFKRHFRAEEAQRVKADGMGIGLFLCREIVLAHGGRIWVESEPGQGSNFIVELPLHPK